MLLKTAPVQIGRENQDPFADFLDRLRDFVESGGERLNVFSLKRSDESLAKLFGQFLRDPFVLPAAVDEFVQTLGRFVVLEFSEKVNQVVNTAVGLLGAGFEEVEKLFVVTKEFANREHRRFWL